MRAGGDERGAQDPGWTSSHGDRPICLQTNTHHLWPHVGLSTGAGHVHPLPLRSAPLL